MYQIVAAISAVGERSAGRQGIRDGSTDVVYN